MTDRFRDSLERWLVAERSGTVERAEQALRELFSLLTEPSPPAGFAERVMSRLAPIPEGTRLALGWRLTLAACLIMAALSVAYVPLILVPLVDAIRVGQLVQLMPAALAAGSRVLVDWLSFWQSLAGVNRVLVTVISRPPVAVTLVAVAGLTAVSFRLLSGMMVAKRSTNHG